VFNPDAYSACSKQGNHKEGKIMENCEADQYWNNIGISENWMVVEFNTLPPR
jgi:hypothetical protein